MTDSPFPVCGEGGRGDEVRFAARFLKALKETLETPEQVISG
jgi:hypothetical protein